MPRDLFGEIVRHEVRIGARRWFGLPLTIFVHGVIIGTVAIVTLVATDELPALPAPITSWVVVESPPPPPAVPASRRSASETPAANRNAAPVDAPAGILPDSGLVSEPDSDPAAGTPGGLPAAIEGAGMTLQPEAPPPPPATPVRITSDLRPPAKIKDALPVYPDFAMRARIEGMVILEATIDTGGKVVDVRVLKSIPLLDRSAIEAVRQWEFTPTRLNGVAVPVVMTVTVNFRLK